MDNSQSRRERIYREWERFQRGESVDDTVIAPYILRSWQRCRLLRVDSSEGSRRRLEPAQLDKVLHKNALLIRIGEGGGRLPLRGLEDGAGADADDADLVAGPGVDAVFHVVSP